MEKDPILKGLKERLPSEKSYANYVVRLKKLDELSGNKGIDYIIKNCKPMYVKIKERYPNINTRRNMITPLLTIISLQKPETNWVEYQKQWKKIDEDLTTLQLMSIKKNRLTEKQAQNYTSLEDVKLKLQELKKTGDAHNSLKSSLQYVLLTLLTDIRPKRSDLGDVMIYRTEPNKKDKNYIVLRGLDDSYIVLNRYKTQKTYGRLEEDLGVESVIAIKESLRKHPRKYLFTTLRGEPYIKNDSYGTFVKATFNSLFGRNTGTSLWRHIYIMEKVEPGAPEEILEETARLMGHDVRMQMRYRKQETDKEVCVCVPKTR